MGHRFSANWLWLLAALACLGAGPCLLRRPHEPSYQGKPLRYWTDHVAGSSFAQSYDAIRAIGADGIPWLLDRVRAANSVHQRGYAAVWPALPPRLGKLLPAPQHAKEVEEKVSHALSLLDTQGVPRLVAGLESRNSSIR